MNAFSRYKWPGNIRELENAIEHAVVLSTSSTLELHSLPPSLLSKIHPQPLIDFEETLSIKKNTRVLEVHLIKQALIESNGIKSKAAKILEISTKTLQYKLKDYQIDLE
jgi:two-component system response regulator AtoC